MEDRNGYDIALRLEAKVSKRSNVAYNMRTNEFERNSPKVRLARSASARRQIFERYWFGEQIGSDRQQELIKPRRLIPLQK